MEQFEFGYVDKTEQQNIRSDEAGHALSAGYRQEGAQKTSGNQEFLKQLRRPRSKKRMNTLAKLDIPSMTDLEIMEKMREQADGAVSGAEAAQEDVEAYLARIQEEFTAMVQKDVAEEERRREELKKAESDSKRLEEELKDSIMEYTLAKCYIRGCTIHSILYDRIIHYKKSEIPQEVQEVFDFYKSVKKCEYVEVYPKHMAALSKRGEVLEIKERDKRG